MQERLPPHDMQAEQSVLGSLLIDPDAIITVSTILLPADFYREAHAQIYKAILHLQEKEQPSDYITLTDELRKQDMMEAVGGEAYIAELINVPPTAQHTEHYAQIVKEKAVFRRFIALGGQLASMGYEQTALAGAQHQKTFQEIMELDVGTRNEYHLYSIEEIEALPDAIPLIEGGLLIEGGRMVIFGPPKGGKTRLILELAMNLVGGMRFLDRFAIGKPSRVLFVEADMPGLRGFKKWERQAREAFGVAVDSPFFVAEGRDINLAEPSGAARLSQYVARSGAEIVILDCLRRLHTADENSATEMETVYRALDWIIAKYQLQGMIIIHHCRKLGTRTLTVEDARGTVGLLDWVDTIIGHDGREETNDALLHFFLVRWDFPPMDLLLNFDWDTFRWTATLPKEVREMPTKVVELILQEHGGRMPLSYLMEEMRKQAIGKRAVYRSLNIMLAEDIIVKEKSLDPSSHHKAKDIILKRMLPTIQQDELEF